jgi:hypothetical protein
MVRRGPGAGETSLPVPRDSSTYDEGMHSYIHLRNVFNKRNYHLLTFAYEAPSTEQAWPILVLSGKPCRAVVSQRIFQTGRQNLNVKISAVCAFLARFDRFHAARVWVALLQFNDMICTPPAQQR